MAQADGRTDGCALLFGQKIPRILWGFGSGIARFSVSLIIYLRLRTLSGAETRGPGLRMVGLWSGVCTGISLHLYHFIKQIHLIDG
jgi:hypothetical protein